MLHSSQPTLFIPSAHYIIMYLYQVLNTARMDQDHAIAIFMISVVCAAMCMSADV